MLTSLGFSVFGCSSDSGEVAPKEEEDATDNNGNTTDELFSFDLNSNPFDVLKVEDSWLLHPSKNYLLVNVDENIRAFTSVCTHSGCSRDWAFANKKAECTCHGSFFNHDGSVDSGPAESALKEFTVSVDGTNITVSE